MYDDHDSSRTVRVRPALRDVWTCFCGRPFTTPGGRANHQRACDVARAVVAWENAAAQDVVDRALARLAADPTLKTVTRRRRTP